MSKVDRRILKTQDAIIKAFIELLSEKNFDDITIQNLSDRANISRGTLYLHYQDKYDLLDKLMETHINELQKLCEDAGDMDFIDGNLIWFEYFERNYLFFSTMLASKGAPSFRNRLLALLIEDLSNEVDTTKGKNKSLNQNIIIQFVGSAYIGILEWWFANKMPFPPRVMAEQIGMLLDRNL